MIARRAVSTDFNLPHTGHGYNNVSYSDVMRFVEDIYSDFLYDCHIANLRLSEEDWDWYGREVHHVEVPDCEGGLLTPLNSQPLTTYQHWIAGVLQSEVTGRKCFAMVPRGVLPPLFEMLRVKWQAHHNRTANFTRRTSEEYAEMGRSGGRKNKGQKRNPHTDERKKRIGDGNRGKKRTMETRQKMRENCFKVEGWVWITNGAEETMVPPEYILPEGWKKGRKPDSDHTRKLKSVASSGENNPMYGVEPKTKSMRWYKNLEQVVEKMFIPGEEPAGWVKGRLTALDRR